MWQWTSTPAGHHDHPAGVDPLGLRADLGDHLAVLDPDVADLAVDAVGGVVDLPPAIRIDVIAGPPRAAG